MNTIKDAVKSWEQYSHAEQPVKKVPVNLALRDIARIRALSELYPGFTEEQFITELISAALDEVEAALPYIKGKKVVSEDEFGDPVYEDIGKTPKFEQLTQEYIVKLEAESGS